MRAWAVLLLPPLLAAGCGGGLDPEPPAETGAVEGIVVRAATQAPVRDAGLVLIDPWSLRPSCPLTLTDSNGRARFDGISPGRYALFVYHDSLFPFERSAPLLTVRAAETTPYTVQMMKSDLWDGSGYRIAGRVIDAADGAPIAGAFVEGVFEAWDDLRLLFQGTSRPDWAITDAEGRFSITALPYTEDGIPVALEPISISRDGYEPASLGGEGPYPPDSPPSLPLPAGEDSTLIVEVRLHRLDGGVGRHGSGGILGRLLDRGRPVPGLAVGLSLLSSSYPDTHRSAALGAAVPIQGAVAWTDAQGSFLFERLTPGLYVIHPAYLSDDGYANIETGRIRVRAGQIAVAPDIELALALLPIAPPDRAVIGERTPEFIWQAYPDSIPYPVWEYKLYVTKGQLEYIAVGGLRESRWTMPDSLAIEPGAHIRWFVDLIGYTNDDGLPETIALFDNFATFRIRP